MRQVILAASILGLFYVALPLEAAGGTAPTDPVTVSVVLPGGVFVREGSSFDVEIRLETNGQGVTAGQVELAFGDSLSFEGGFNDTTSGTWTTAFGNIEPFLLDGNVVLAVTATGDSSVSGPDVLVATLTFTASAEVPSTAILALEPFLGTTGTVFLFATTAYTTNLSNASVTILASTPTHTPGGTVGATPTRTPSDVCPCDCNSDGVVSIDELVLAVDIALMQQDVAACPAADRNDDGRVSVDELVAGVQAGLDGC